MSRKAVSVPSYSAQYWFIQMALSGHERSFAELESRMDAFQPLPLAAFELDRRRMWDQLRPHNSHMSDEELRRYIDGEVSKSRSAEWQTLDAFLEPFAAEAVAITVLAHALAEGAINAALALGLEHFNRLSEFESLERKPFEQKWREGPRLFLPSYTLTGNPALDQGLSELCRRRNEYVHSKVTLRDEANEVVLAGAHFDSMSIGSEARALVRSYLALPYALHQHLVSQIAHDHLRFKIQNLLRRTG